MSHQAEYRDRQVATGHCQECGGRNRNQAFKRCPGCRARDRERTKLARRARELAKATFDRRRGGLAGAAKRTAGLERGRVEVDEGPRCGCGLTLPHYEGARVRTCTPEARG